MYVEIFWRKFGFFLYDYLKYNIREVEFGYLVLDVEKFVDYCNVFKGLSIIGN